MCKRQEPTVQQSQQSRMSQPTVDMFVPQSSQLSHAMNAIFGLPEDGSSIGQKAEKAFNKMERLEKKIDWTSSNESRNEETT